MIATLSATAAIVFCEEYDRTIPDDSRYHPGRHHLPAVADLSGMEIEAGNRGIEGAQTERIATKGLDCEQWYSNLLQRM